MVLQTAQGEDAVIALHVLKEQFKQQRQLPFAPAQLHPFADMNRVILNGRCRFGLEADRNAANVNIMPAIGPALHELGGNA
ncbi:hypothetical protein FQZ97_1012560 [compost metagenome]